MYKLYEHQAVDIEKIRAEYRAGATSVLHVAPTGYGKTIVFSYIAKNAYEKGKSILILTHRNNLLNQTSKKLKEIGLNHGIIASGYPSIRYKIQVASIQTLVRRLNNWKFFDLIISDECHHIGSKTLQKIKNYFFNNNKKMKLYGCTATPLRLDGYGMGNDFDTIVIGANYNYLINKINPLTGRGFLSKPKYYIPSHIDLEGIKKTMGDYNKRQLRERIENDKYIIGNSIEYYAKWAEYKPCMIFCININEAEKTAEKFRKAGYIAKSIHSKMNYRDVEKIIYDLKDGRVHVVTSCDMIGEGTDIPRVEVIIQNRPTMSLTINHQQHGRGLRPYPGKEFSIHIDQVGNCERHGLIHWPIKWELTKGKFEYNPPSVKVCNYCFATYESNKRVCPYCGMINVRKKRNRREMEQMPGDLKEINYRELNDQIKESETLDDYKSLAVKYNYSQTWAYHMFHDHGRRKEKV